MGKYDKEYEAFQIFEQIQGQEEAAAAPPLPLSRVQTPKPVRPPEPVSPVKTVSPVKPVGPVSQQEAPYYEIEYDSCPMPGVGRFVLKTDKIAAQPPQQDEVRERFNRMRDIARESRYLHFGNSKFYDKKIQQENSRIFYQQGVFMQDFEDDCEKVLPYSAYFPNYQMMGYGQLRTYFTWRTQVRKGDIQQTSLSYAFLYLYELLNNIGVDSPQDGLERLMVFWETYRVYDQSIDKYVLRWLKDYHIFYELPLSFREFVDQNGLSGHYPNLSDSEDQFGLYCAISRYDIRKSAFYTEERQELIKECFRFTVERLRQVFTESHMNLDKSIFQPTKHMSVWTPFSGALFHPAARLRERRVVLSEKEIYLCDGRQWTFSTMITTESGRQLLGYVLKQMESVLRRLTQYKYRLSANPNMLSPVMADELRKKGISLEAVVTEAATNAYREATRTVVRVDQRALERIRQEALVTQEKLIVPDVPEREDAGDTGWQAAAGDLKTAESFLAAPEAAGQRAAARSVVLGQKPVEEFAEEERDVTVSFSPTVQETENRTVASKHGDTMPKQQLVQTRDIAVENGNQEERPGESHRSAERNQVQETLPNPWESLKGALTEIERKALSLAFGGESRLKPFADEQGIMLEVLADGINEKAMDHIGDSLLDDAFEIYEDYIEEVKGMVESI